MSFPEHEFELREDRTEEKDTEAKFIVPLPSYDSFWGIPFKPKDHRYAEAISWYYPSEDDDARFILSGLPSVDELLEHLQRQNEETVRSGFRPDIDQIVGTINVHIIPRYPITANAKLLPVVTEPKELAHVLWNFMNDPFKATFRELIGPSACPIDENLYVELFIYPDLCQGLDLHTPQINYTHFLQLVLQYTNHLNRLEERLDPKRELDDLWDTPVLPFRKPTGLFSKLESSKGHLPTDKFVRVDSPALKILLGDDDSPTSMKLRSGIPVYTYWKEGDGDWIGDRKVDDPPLYDEPDHDMMADESIWPPTGVNLLSL
ncbi:hypothetical protein OEA41_005561 [Lepraria neglecta]|uniref:Uncharacterized protein n=1 Tax=Lepraria neglecta TaxID=209136 RepID=A0AAE0DJV0_9LECA|nr:hypothetical protein OEA41_005561 [Lepraria neglecta]